MITCCLNCTSRHQACHDTCEKYKAEKKDFEKRKAFVYELNHSQSVYHRDYEDKHREKGKKRFLGSEFRGERG
jgi:UDP-N-acetylmuramoylalanine-D-glutamate ligase